MSYQPPSNPNDPTYTPPHTQYPPQPPYVTPSPLYQQQPYQPPPMYPPPPNIMVMQQRQQLSFLIRALYFCFIGWWFGIAWAVVALCLIITIIGAPIGLLMLNALPTVLTLYQK